jgi:monoamine oxidase
MGNPKTLVFTDGKRMTVARQTQTEKLPFDLADHERGKTWTQLWNEATSEFRRRYEEGGQESLDDLLHEYDQYSTREFLVMRGFSEGALELYGVMSFRESNMNAAVVEQLREIVAARSRTCRRSPAAWTCCHVRSTRTSSRTCVSERR